ncbi:MAG: DoxX [Nocardioidaceae bacterium]|nr:DoxX [Nocardioidaceae bacterium]
MSVLETTGSRVRELHASWRVVDLAAVLIRGVLGFTFVGHGAQKLFGWFGGGGISGTTDFFTFIDVPAPHLTAVVVGLVEFFGGLLILVGLLTVPFSLLLVLDMVGAIATFNHAHGFFVESPNGGWELNFVLIGLAGALALLGAGRWSVDQAIGLGREDHHDSSHV